MTRPKNPPHPSLSMKHSRLPHLRAFSPHIPWHSPRFIKRGTSLRLVCSLSTILLFVRYLYFKFIFWITDENGFCQQMGIPGPGNVWGLHGGLQVVIQMNDEGQPIGVGSEKFACMLYIVLPSWEQLSTCAPYSPTIRGLCPKRKKKTCGTSFK